MHQSDAGPPFVGTATLKVPPSWSVERNHVYSLRSWISDLVLWSSATEIDPARQGPIAALQVQGSAKELVRELMPMQLRDGDVDQMTGQHVTGLTLLVTVLARRYDYAPSEAENCTRSISEFLQFRRAPNERIDNVLVRYDILRYRAQQRAGFAINVTGLSWLLLQSLQLSSESWDRLLSPLGGNMPSTDQEFADLTERVRRLFHLKEGRFAGASQQQGAMGDPGAYFADGGYFPTFTEHHDISTPPNEAVGHPPANSAYAAGGPFPPDPWANASSQAPFMSGAGVGWSSNVGGEAWNASASFHASNDGSCPTSLRVECISIKTMKVLALPLMMVQRSPTMLTDLKFIKTICMPKDVGGSMLANLHVDIDDLAKVSVRKDPTTPLQLVSFLRWWQRKRWIKRWQFSTSQEST